MINYELNWKFTHENQKMQQQLANSIADEMTDNEFYWSKIQEALNSREINQYLESLGIDVYGKSQNDLENEVSLNHYGALKPQLEDYLDYVCRSFERHMYDIFSNEILSNLDYFDDVESIDYKDMDEESIILEFSSEVEEPKIKRFMQKVFEKNCADYDTSNLENF